MRLIHNLTRALFSAAWAFAGAAAVAVQAPAAPAASTASAARTLLLVRHGHYLDQPNADKRLGSQLSALGVAQARLAGARLAALPEPFDGLYVSPLQRARDTAASIGEAIGNDRFTVVDDLTECTPPTRNADIMAREKPADLAACQAQLDRAFAAHFKPASGTARRELLVCHANVIRYLVTRALDVDPKAWLAMSVGHASITTIRVEPDGRVRVLGVGDTGHIPANLQTRISNNPEGSLVPRALPAAVRPEARKGAAAGDEAAGQAAGR